MQESATIDGIDGPAVEQWLSAHVDGATPPFTYRRIGEGRSNLTFAVTGSNGERFVLRRPPLGHVLATAHDMTREFRVISAFGLTDVPVPAALGLCEDPEVNGAPFFVMGLVEGEVLDSVRSGESVPVEQRRPLTDDLVRVLAALHNVDPDSVGLGDLGRREGYVERQLKRWTRQWHDSRTRDLPAVDSIAAELQRRVPTQQVATIVHGDYRFGNTIVDPAAGRVRAVLDWELCTLGDPLADLGYLAVHWSDDVTEAGRHNDPTGAGGFGTFASVLERYGQDSSLDLSGIDYYVAFQNWRLAIILEGVYARYQAGAMGADSDKNAEIAALGEGIHDLIAGAQAALDRC